MKDKSTKVLDHCKLKGKKGEYILDPGWFKIIMLLLFSPYPLVEVGVL